MKVQRPQILVLAPELVPLPGLPTVGGGLRGWTLAEGLRSAGFTVTLCFPREPLEQIANQLDPAAVAAARPYTFSWEDPAAVLRDHPADAVVCCSWYLAAQLGQCPVPLAVDLAGPVLLEFLYQAPTKAQEHAAWKPQALAAADFVTCAGERQRAYFTAWLMIAGFSTTDLRERLAVVPISTSPDLPPLVNNQDNDEPQILFAGVALPWQDPLVGLQATLATLERHERGTLEVYLYADREHSRGVTWLTTLQELASTHPRLRLHESQLRSYTAMRDLYRQADLAFDLFAPNAERQLAFNTRTVDYLACGLPPLYSPYAELAAPIAQYGAGLVVDPTDPVAIEVAITAALTDPASLQQRRAAAQRLVADLLTWETTIAPLAAWCAAPTRREHTAGLTVHHLTNTPSALLAAEEEAQHWQAVAQEREQYARYVETAWQERGEALLAQQATTAGWQQHPWQHALRTTLGRRNKQQPSEEQ